MSCTSAALSEKKATVAAKGEPLRLQKVIDSSCKLKRRMKRFQVEVLAAAEAREEFPYPSPCEAAASAAGEEI